jgi:hypothetical protein
MTDLLCSSMPKPNASEMVISRPRCLARVNMPLELDSGSRVVRLRMLVVANCCLMAILRSEF